MNTLLQSPQFKVYSLKTRLQKLAEPEGEWKTINGRHVLVGKGETPLEALNKSLPGKDDTGGLPAGKISYKRSDMGGYVADVGGKTIGFIRQETKLLPRGKSMMMWKAKHKVLGDVDIPSNAVGKRTKADAMKALEKAHEDYLKKAVNT